MTTTPTSRLGGLTTSVSIKAPCKATSDSNLTLAGEQTIDGVSCVTGDRVLVKSQTTGADNGIYIVSTSSWTRADDFNGARDVVKGTRINVTGGTNAGDYLISTADPITIGTTSIAFNFVPVTEITDLSQLDGDSDDIAQGSTNLYITLAEKSKLAGIEALAEVNLDIVAGTNITVTGGNGVSWTIDAGAGATALGDLTDVTADATVNGGIYGLQYATAGGGSYDDVLLTDTFYTESELGTGALDGRYYTETEADTIFAAASHTHTLSDITDAGTIASQNANSMTISGGNATLTSGTFTNIVFDGTTHTATTGTDTSLVSGTAGTSGNLVSWDVNGDAVDSGIAVADVGTGFDTVSVTGTTKTLSLTDANTIQECSNASAQLITVPLNSSVAFPTGTEIHYEQHGAGSLAIIGASGVSINGVDTGTVTLGEQYNGMRTRKIATDSWIAYKWTLMTSVAPNPVVASLDFPAGANTDYLSMTDANFGAFSNYAKWAIAGSIYVDAATYSDARIMAQDGTGFAFRLYNRTIGGQNDFTLLVQDASSNQSQYSSAASSLPTGSWKAFLIHFDSANATSGDRIKMWINNSADTPANYTAPTAAMRNSASVISVGASNAGSSNLNGRVYSLAFFDNYLPTASEVFDGSAGKLKDLSGITGLKSLLTGSTATDDYLLTDWTNNGAVATSATVP